MKSYCRFCGQFSDSKEQFCPTCGYKFNTRSIKQNFEMLDGISITFISNGDKACFTRRKNHIKGITAYGEWKAVYTAYSNDCLSWKIENGALVLEEKSKTEDFYTSEKGTYPENTIRRLDETDIQFTDKKLGTERVFHQQKILIGRSADCDLVNENTQISRQHAEIFYKKTGWYILDRNSTNGTFLNGERLKKTKPIRLPAAIRLVCQAERVMFLLFTVMPTAARCQAQLTIALTTIGMFQKHLMIALRISVRYRAQLSIVNI